MTSLPTILLVEDDLLSARSVQRLLRRARTPVTHVSSCEAARTITQRFLLGVFDVELQDGSGVELASELLADERIEAVVFYTGCAREDVLREAARLGEIVVKGASGPELLEAIARARKPETASPPAYAPRPKLGSGSE